MSSIYIQEPPTSGKVLLKTSVGDIDIELWARECPKACRNFIQLCMEGYYNGTIFHRVVKGFIAQGGDPNGNGSGGESIYGEPFKDEFHSRLRFSRRGLVAMANSDKDDNGSQFFFTLGATPELQNKHTLFGKVTGDTVFNMLRLEEGLVDHNERPLYPQKIIKADILNNPFPDIVPRSLKTEEKKDKKKVKEKGVKNFGLLSFGEEAEEDEEKTNEYVKKTAGKSKSTHDVLDDPKLSKDTLDLKPKDEAEIEEYDRESEAEEDIKAKTERIKEKLGSKKSSKVEKKKTNETDDEDDDYLKTIEQEQKERRKQKAEEIRNEITSLKKQYKKERKVKDELIDKQLEKDATKEVSNELMKEYLSEKDKYSHLRTSTLKKGASREQFTLELLSKFRNKLNTLREQSTEEDDPEQDDPEEDERVIEEDIKSDDWLAHKLNFEQNRVPVLAKDASTKSDDWYDVFDPRNPLNKRKRGERPATDSDSKKNKAR